MKTQIKKELTLKQVELNQSRAKLTELTKTESDLRKQLNDERHNRIDTAKQNDAKLKESPKPLSSALGLNKSTIDHNSGMPSNDQHDAIVKFVKSTDKKAGSKPLATPDSDKTKHDKSL